MIYTIKNDFLEITADSFGGELHSIKNLTNNKEYLWNGDKKFWARHAPVLFPVVGKVQENSIWVDEKRYPMTSHGFARDKEFTLEDKNQNSLNFSLLSDEETLKRYPYNFKLNIIYTLDKNTVNVEYIVTNKDTKEMLFSIGAHPAFNCPLHSDETILDYYLEFSDNETLDLVSLTGDGFFKRATTPYLNDEKIINVTENLFDNDALVFKNYKSKTLALKSKKHNSSVTVNIDKFPCLGIWSKKGSPFICIEPWHGHADYCDFQGEFRDKSGINSLKEKESFSCVHGYTIE